MFWSFGAPKGGLGVSVTAAGAALLLARSTDVCLVDFHGDISHILGVDTSGRPGIVDWLSSESRAEADALDRLSIPLGSDSHTLKVLPRGDGQLSDVPIERLVEAVQYLGQSGFVVADVGQLSSRPMHWSSIVCAASDRTTLVLRACYMALRRTQRLAAGFDDVVELVEPGRALKTVDIEAVVGQPITARGPVDPAVARAADAGLLRRRLPRSLRRTVSDLVSVVDAVVPA